MNVNQILQGNSVRQKWMLVLQTLVIMVGTCSIKKPASVAQ